MNGKRRIIYVISGISDRAMSFEWIAESNIAQDFELSFTLLNESPHSSLQRYLEATGCPVHHVPYAGKRDLARATYQLTRLFQRLKPDVVHTHLTGANLAGLSAAAAARVPKRIYTRHHTTLNHDYYSHAVIYDMTANRLATDIVATCENGKHVLMTREDVPESKIRLINIGFRLEKFGDVPEERVQAMRRKYRIEGHRPVIGVISKYIEWKGIQYAIPAFKEVLAKHPEAVLILANARPSPYTAVLKRLLDEISPDSYREIEFEVDVPALFKTFDVFVHLPIDPEVEAFGQVYVEALASRLPSVFTVSGIAREFARDGENCLVAPFHDSKQTARNILRLVETPEFASEIALRGDLEVRERFGIASMLRKMTELYRS
jgi:glycosyltransferase involved in cell wall biosynthesis